MKTYSLRLNPTETQNPKTPWLWIIILIIEKDYYIKWIKKNSLVKFDYKIGCRI